MRTRHGKHQCHRAPRPSTAGLIQVDRYNRKLPDGLEAFVAGRVALPCAHRSRDLFGAAVGKTSLKMSDFPTVRERRAIVHPKIEAIKTVAAQSRHDVLAADAARNADRVSPHGEDIGRLPPRRHR